MNRLNPLDINALTPEQQAVLDAMQSGPRGARHGRLGLVGPFGVWVRSPTVGNAVQTFGAAVRFESSLPENVKEVAICTVGAHFHAKFEFGAHGPMAIAAGVSEEAVDAIRRNRLPSLEDETEALAYDIATALLKDHRMRDELYSRAKEVFGEEALIELVTIIGYYCLVSLTLNAFEIALPSTMEDPFPEVS